MSLVAAVPATVEHALGRYGIQVRSADALRQTHRHKIEPGAAAMFTALHRGECPDLLWIQWHRGVRRHDVATLRAAVESVSKLAEAQLAQKKVDLRRMELAREKGVATDLEVEHARLDVTISDLSLALSRFEHKQNRRKYEEAQIQVRRMKLSCPPAGRDQNKKDPLPTYKVEKVFVQCGESVDRLQDVIRIVKIDPLWIDVPVPLTQVRAMHLNVAHVAHVRFPDAPDRPVTCKVTHVAAVADAASATLTVRLEVPNPSGRPAGEQVTVQFDASKRPASPGKTRLQAKPGAPGAPLTKTATTETMKG